MSNFIIWIVFGALANIVIGLFDVFVVTEPSFLGFEREATIRR